MVAIIAFAALFLGGGVLGLTLAEALAPASAGRHPTSAALFTDAGRVVVTEVAHGDTRV